MKTVKEISRIAGISIRTLRYYDEIGLLKPSKVTEAGYRLYDRQALEKLQEIMFFRELELPLSGIKKIIENPDYDKTQILSAQKILLEQKRNRLNGIIDLITDMLRGANTMGFEAFSEQDIQEMFNHILDHMSEENVDEQVKKYGSIEKYKEHLSSGITDEKNMFDLLKWYGSKEKVKGSVMKTSGEPKEKQQEQAENTRIYSQFMAARETHDSELEHRTVEMLAENYKKMFGFDNARNILIDLAKEYLNNEQLAAATDSQFGKGCAEYVAHAIGKYYGTDK